VVCFPALWEQDAEQGILAVFWRQSYFRNHSCLPQYGYRIVSASESICFPALCCFYLIYSSPRAVLRSVFVFDRDGVKSGSFLTFLYILMDDLIIQST
jgi:hypothetical protein